MTKIHPTNCKCLKCRSRKKDSKDVRKIYVSMIVFIVSLCIIL